MEKEKHEKEERALLAQMSCTWLVERLKCIATA